MIRASFRFLGLWFLAAAVVMAVIDGTRSIAGAALTLTPLAETWTRLHATSFQAARGALERWLGAGAFESFGMGFLALPTGAVLFVLATLFLLAGRPKRDIFG